MRKLGLILLAGAAFAQAPSTDASPYKQVSTMSQLMISIVFPTSDAVFYVDREAPKTQAEWNALADKALTLAESGNLMLMPGRMRDDGNWVKYTRMMIDAGFTAYKAAKAQDLEGVRGVNDLMYQSCVECHSQYRTNYPRRPAAQKK